MSWKDRDGNELEAGDTVIVEGKIVGRHSGDQVSVEIAPGQRVLIGSFACSQGTAPKTNPNPQPSVEQSRKGKGKGKGKGK